MYRLFRNTTMSFEPQEMGIRESSRVSKIDMIAKLGKQNSIIGVRFTDEDDEEAEMAAAIADIEEKDEVPASVTASMGSSETEFDADPKFDSKFSPHEMRLLALVAHNHMKPAMKEFVLQHQNLLKKFKLTGTGTTMKMLREVFGEKHMEEFGGPVCKSGPLGGDAELVALMCTENLGALIFFQDPMDAHPHTADIECLNRQTNVYNILTATNPTSAHALTFVLRHALEMGEPSMIPSMFLTCESPSVEEYKNRQQAVLKSLTTGGGK